MKTILIEKFGGPETLKLREKPALNPGEGQVVVALKAVGVNPVETYIRAGNYARLPALPYTPGTDGAGLVARVGSGVTGLKEGDRVYISGSLTGTYAEEALCLPGQVHPLPEKGSFEAGACLGVPAATAYRALFQKARVRSGEWLLVHGATGGVGLSAVRLASLAGVRVIGTGSTAEGRKAVLGQGAEAVLDHSAEGYLEEVRKITGGAGADAVLEMVAHRNLGKDLTVLARYGRAVIIGSRGTVEINPRDVMASEGMIMGMLLWSTPEAELKEIHQGLYTRLEKGEFSPVIRKTLPLDQAPRAHEEVLLPGAAGNIVLIP